MSEHDAITTFLVCFSSPGDANHGKPGVQICLGMTPQVDATNADAAQFFFKVTLSNVRAHLPSPLPGSQPVVGTINVAETLLLSAQDLRNLKAWLSENLPPSRSD